MGTFIALLRGVNVGGKNRLPMAELRAALEADGLERVRTYIQSGNVLVTSSVRDPEAVGARVRAVIARGFALDVPAITLTADQLADLAARSPYLEETDPRRVHAIVLPAPATEADREALAARVAAVRAKGRLGRDAVTVDGRVAYLHTPDGFGTSELAKVVTTGRTAPLAEGTARNWATVTTLLEMCGR